MNNNVSITRRNLTFVLLFLVAILSYIDRQIFTLFQDDIKLELGLDDMQLGLLTGLSFAAFYTLAAFPIARYADRGDRRLVITISVIVWSLATAICGMANSLMDGLGSAAFDQDNVEVAGSAIDWADFDPLGWCAHHAPPISKRSASQASNAVTSAPRQ